MHYFIFPDRDSTLYSDTPTENAGIDELLEIAARNVDGTTNNNLARAVIHFDLTQLSQSLNAGAIAGPTKYYLNLYTTEAFEIPLNYTIYAYPISGSWTMGTGRRFNLPVTTNGVSYTFRDGNTYWDSTSTASLGGKWISGSGYEASQSFTYQTSDIHMDVTDIVNKWLSGSIDNNGFILKYESSIEAATASAGYIKFFSNETNTIYRPRLEAVWVDAVFSPPTTQSRTAITASDTWISQSAVYNVNYYYTGGLGVEYIQSGSSSLYIKETYGTTLSAQFEFLTTFSYYISESYTPVTKTFTYSSGSSTAISSSIVSYTTSSFRTGSLGAEFVQSASSTTWQYYAPVTYSNTFILDAYGIYASSSISQSLLNYTYLSSSITGYSSSSINSYVTVSIVDNPVIFINNIADEYLQNSRVRFNISARKRYPTKVFTTGSWYYLPTLFLPSSSYYSIRDAYSEEEVIPFSKYSQISADNSSSYFKLWLDGLEPERYYRVLIKIMENGLQTIYDKDYKFRIIR